MIQRFSVKIVEWQIRKGILSNEDKATYEYAYEVLIAKTVNIVIAIIIALIFRSLLIVLILLASYVPMRTYAGGYHAKTNESCTMVSAGIICTVCVIVKQYPSAYILPFHIICGIISSIIYWRVAPVGNINKPLDEVETKRYRTIARIIWAIEILIVCVMYCMGFEIISFTVILSLTIVSLMLVLGKFTEGDTKNETVE